MYLYSRFTGYEESFKIISHIKPNLAKSHTTYGDMVIDVLKLATHKPNKKTINMRIRVHSTTLLHCNASE